MIQDYAAYLSAEAASDLVAFHQFRLLYVAGADELHVFFEGEDDSLFYMPEIRRFSSGKTVHKYVCGGKCNVIRSRERVSEGDYDIRCCMFFVDRDFDDYIGNQAPECDEIYITSSYSIESELLSAEAVEIILEDVLHVSRADPEFARIIHEYSHLDDQFARVLRPFMAWCIAARSAGIRPNLSNIQMKSVVLIAAGTVTKRSSGFERFVRSAVGSGATANPASVLSWARRLDFANRKLWIRGKFYLWFFQHALLSVIDASSARRTAAGGKAWKIPAALKDARLMELLGGRVPPPASLIRYLASRAEIRRA